MDTHDILSAVDHGAELARRVTQEHEIEAIRQLENQLHRAFPSVPAALVDDVVEQHYHKLDGSPIRDYIPVLVEHAAKADLISLAR